MRNIFTCFFLCILVWLIQQGPLPILEPASFVGILAILPVILADFAERSGFPAFIGALLAGLLMGPTGLFSETAIESVHILSEIALVWVGLYLGASVTPSLISDRRYLVPSIITVMGATLVSFFVFVFGFGFAPEDALRLGLLASVGAPILMLRSLSKQVEALSFSLLTSGLGLLFLGIVLSLQSTRVHTISLELFLEIGSWLVGVEVVNRCLRRIRTDWGRFFLFGTVTLIVFLASKRYGISALLLSSVSGLLLSLRREHPDASRILGRLSQLLVPFIIAEFAVNLIPSDLGSLAGRPFTILLAFALCVGLGKSAGLFLSSRLSAGPPGAYHTVLPQGILSAGLFIPLLPIGILPVPAQSFEIAFVLVCGAGISLCTLPFRILGGGGLIGPIQRPPEDDKPHPREALG